MPATTPSTDRQRRQHIVRYNAGGFGNDVINSFDAGRGRATRTRSISARSGSRRRTSSPCDRKLDGRVADTLITVRDAGGFDHRMGTIRINGVTPMPVQHRSATRLHPGCGCAAARSTAPTAAPNASPATAAPTRSTALAATTPSTALAAMMSSMAARVQTPSMARWQRHAVRRCGQQQRQPIVDNFGTASYANSNGTVDLRRQLDGRRRRNHQPDGRRHRDQRRPPSLRPERRWRRNIGALSIWPAHVGDADLRLRGRQSRGRRRASSSRPGTSQPMLGRRSGGTLGSTTGNGNGTFNATLSANQIGATLPSAS